MLKGLFFVSNKEQTNRTSHQVISTSSAFIFNWRYSDTDLSLASNLCEDHLLGPSISFCCFDWNSTENNYLWLKCLDLLYLFFSLKRVVKLISSSIKKYIYWKIDTSFKHKRVKIYSKFISVTSQACFLKAELMHLNGFREKHLSERKRGDGYGTKRCKAEEEMHWADGSVLSGVQGPAEKELLHRGKEAEMRR